MISKSPNPEIATQINEVVIVIFSSFVTIDDYFKV